MKPKQTASGHPVRWWIIFLLFIAFTLNILDRQVLSLVAPVLREQLHLSNTQYGVIVFSFLLGMTLGQVPIGMLMDRKGARIGFSFIVTWWSGANFLHAFAGSLAQFSALRFLLGIGECGNYSGAVKVIGQWFPPKERALAAGLFNSGSLAGAVVAPPLVVWLTLRWGWQAAFLLPSVLGMLWILPWLRVYWEPWRHPSLSPAERALAEEGKPPAIRGPDRLLPLLRYSPVWGVVLIRAFGGPVTHFYWYWLPEYLKSERGMSMEMIGMFAWLPFFSGGVGQIGGGWFSSWLLRRGWSLNASRKTAFGAGVGLCLFALLVPAASHAAAAVAFICLASLGINACSATLVALQTDLFPQRVLARISSFSGVGDGFMSMIMMLATGVVVDRYSYLPVFIAAGVMPLIALTSLLVLVGKVRLHSELDTAR